MAPARKREHRGNQYYDVGVQGRKTGITLEDKGVRDEYGLEPISGIFSSPEKSPPKRGASSRSTRGTVTESESMEIQESSLPDLTTSAHILRNSRTHLPPPRSRSPMKTALNSSPRRQSSMAPRAQSIGRSSPLHAVSHQAVNRVLDFEQDGSSLQDTPALSGSGQRRGKRPDIYDIETSPSRQQSPTLEESVLQEEITAMDNGVAEETFFARIGDDSIPPAEDADVSIEESEIVTEVVKVPAKRGRKRKSDAVESAAEDESNTSKTTKQSSTSARGQGAKKKRKSITQSRRSKRVSDISEHDTSALTDASIDDSEQVIEPPPSLPRPRGRPPKAKKEAVKSAPRSTAATTDKADEPIFKKPKAIAKPKVRQETSKKNTPAQAMDREQNSSSGGLEAGKLVDAYGKPLSKSEIEQMSTTSVGSRYGRGRNLSVFRELDPDTVARVGRTGRHRVAPIDFWKNDRITYNHDGSMNSIVKNEEMEPQKRATRNTGKKGKKRGLKAIDEEDEVELDPWEEDEGLLIGNFREFDPINEVTTSDLMEGAIAWAEKGINPVDVPDASFKFAKLGSAGDESFLSWGFIELLQDHMKRSKNSRKMHMVFHVQQGTVEVKMHENEFVVHRGGVWQVPRGNTYSIRNIGNATARVFFAQAFETKIEV